MATLEELKRRPSHAGHGVCAYSHFPVGAALECEDGAVFTGCNIENSSYGLTNCAERTAAFKAVSEGHRRFKRIVIAGRSDDYCYPCGACRQVLYEFGPDMEVVCLNKKGEEKRLSIRELLPYGFDQTWLAIDEKITKRERRCRLSFLFASVAARGRGSNRHLAAHRFDRKLAHRAALERGHGVVCFVIAAGDERTLRSVSAERNAPLFVS